jgi:hypothetical protein
MRTSRIALTICATLLLAGAPVFAQQAAPPPTEDVTALAKMTQNPVGDVTSVPYQFSFNTSSDIRAHDCPERQRCG